METKLLQMLGLAMRARKVISGEEQVLIAMRKGSVYLLLLSADASGNTKKKMTDKAASYQIPVLQLPSREVLGRAIGKEQRVVVALTDVGFAKRCLELYQQFSGGEEHGKT